MHRIDNYKERKIETLITIVIAFCVLSGVLSWQLNFFIFWPLIISGVVLFFGFLIPKLGLFITFFWFEMAHYIGGFSSKVILTIIYFTLITPYALILKIFNKKDVLGKKTKEKVFVKRYKKIEPQDFENPW